MTGQSFIDSPLPIDAVLPQVRQALCNGTTAVVMAPPGAGKTTRIPLFLLNEPWLAGQQIILLEPRRIAARNAAQRMARSLGQSVGATVGMRTRLETRVSDKTRIVVVTEGVFTRMILNDPALNGIGAILFDEFHERSLDADFGLALARDTQGALREGLRILAMSATLQDEELRAYLDDAPAIESSGRSFPIETQYLGRDTTKPMEQQMAATIGLALRRHTGSILAFLPGQREILRVEQRLLEAELPADTDIAPLFGALDPKRQDAAIAAAPPGRRKVVLATDVAETSLTIEGVTVVVDCGLARVPRFEPGVGITRLQTLRASRASVDQRRGRAGRTSPGFCYRLWDEPQTRALPAHKSPEIFNADLSGLCLNCSEWGVTDPTDLDWLDVPPVGALAAAKTELRALQAIDADGRITNLGRAIHKLPLPPRLACMLVEAARRGAAKKAASIAAILVEQGLGGRETDLSVRLDKFQRDGSARAKRMRRLADEWARAASAQGTCEPGQRAGSSEPSLAEILNLAFPERVGIARGGAGEFLLANGRRARLPEDDPLARSKFVVVAELQGAADRARILLACQASQSQVEDFAASRITTCSEASFDVQSGGVSLRRVGRLDNIVLKESAAARTDIDVSDEELAAILARGLAARGIDRLPWSPQQLQTRARVGFLSASGVDVLPDLTDEALEKSAEQWLAPFIVGKMRMSQITAADLDNALQGLLPYPLLEKLDDQAPTHFTAPTGNRHSIDYQGEDAPALHIRVQELYGINIHPSLAKGRLPLTLHLLSPANRPVQITRDLPRFWSGTWSSVKAEMKGCYPKHVWPDDPASAVATDRARKKKKVPGS